MGGTLQLRDQLMMPSGLPRDMKGRNTFCSLAFRRTRSDWKWEETEGIFYHLLSLEVFLQFAFSLNYNKITRRYEYYSFLFGHPIILNISVPTVYIPWPLESGQFLVFGTMWMTRCMPLIGLNYKTQ